MFTFTLTLIAAQNSERGLICTHPHNHHRCRHPTMHKADYAAITQAVAVLAQSPDDQNTELIREALQIIDEAFDSTWGYACQSDCPLTHAERSLDKTTSLYCLSELYR